MELVFRTPTLAEAPAFAALHVQCWREAYAGIVPKALLDAADVAAHTQRWQQLLVEPGRFVLGAYVDGRPAGFINAGSPLEELYEAEDGHVAAIYVLAAHYRRGIGRQLLGAAAVWWRQQGGFALGLAALAGNQQARHFYEAQGGQLVKTGIYFWHGFALPDVVYHFADLAALGRSAPIGPAGQ